MSPVRLVIFWHMHQPQYRDPASGSYVLPWTRLHALKDYWGMVRALADFPGVHATFNMVPSLAVQLEEYASGNFNEPWFTAAFAPGDALDDSQKLEILERAFQLNHENLMHRWPRFVELFEWRQRAGREAAMEQFHLRDWRDLQALSQLAWFDEEYLANDPVIAPLARKGSEYTEEDKTNIREKQIELIGRVLPEYRSALERGQIEISTTPFYHPILPLICNSDIARVANPYTPLPQPPFRHPEDAREQLLRARQCHERIFGRLPAGLWPSEGSVSNEVLEIAADLGFRWFATDEGVLGRTLSVGFWRDGEGLPENARSLYSPWRIVRSKNEIAGIYRDHQLSDLVGFVYSRMDAGAAAEDLHRRIRLIGERLAPETPVICLILDGENAWEYYPGNGREFLRRFYRLIEADPEIHPLTVSEAIAAAQNLPVLPGTFPASWINANFDIWIGHADDVRAWQFLGEARDVFELEARKSKAGDSHAVSAEHLAAAYESILAAEGSDWCWWYGPENSSSNDADFDTLFRNHLTAVYASLGLPAPESLSQPIARPLERARIAPPSGYLRVRVDGRETSFFEWLGAGLYVPDRRSGAMHGRAYYLDAVLYGFSDDAFFVRVDPVPGSLDALQEYQIRLTLRTLEEVRITLHVSNASVKSVAVERNGHAWLDLPAGVSAVSGKILEVAVPRTLVPLGGRSSLQLSVALWRGEMPLDSVPSQGSIAIELGALAFAWPVESP
ncbi:MAG: glycoside hydrolase family 57 protein [Candidatus Acidiferrales bacterium]